MVIHALHDADGAEAHGLADGEAGEHEREGCSDCVEKEGFGEGVVEGTKGVGDREAVVVGVHGSCVEGRKEREISERERVERGIMA